MSSSAIVGERWPRPLFRAELRPPIAISPAPDITRVDILWLISKGSPSFNENNTRWNKI